VIDRSLAGDIDIELRRDPRRGFAAAVAADVGSSPVKRDSRVLAPSVSRPVITYAVLES